jgi:hypothetical protein
LGRTDMLTWMCGLLWPLQNPAGIQWIRHECGGAGEADVSMPEDLAAHVKTARK